MNSAKQSYKSLEERLNRFPLGAPPSNTLYRILEILFSEKEASLVAQLPIKPFMVKTAAKAWKLEEKQTQKILEELASRAILLDVEDRGVQRYVLPPPMAGFFEFSLMRTRNDINQKLLAELYHQYLNVEEEFVTDLFLGSETRLGRIFVQEPVLSSDNAVHVLDYERATHMLEEASHIGISECYCRKKMQYVEKGCEAPMDICMTFNNAARSLIKYEHARQVDVVEGKELLQQAYENNLVQCGENAQKNISFICNCCGCCCEGLLAVKKFGSLRPVHTSNFIPAIDAITCTGCGKCVKACPINAISITTIKQDKELSNITRKVARIDEDICLGCGVCVRSCPKVSIKLEHRGERIITPVDSVHRTVMMAIERGKLHELVFDNQAFASHRAMAAVLGSILRLPPIKQAVASEQLKSVYLGKLIEKHKEKQKEKQKEKEKQYN
ncbi:4Fe-4S dicluster domain-containing protein [Desulfuribacillus alkaliarsenatis]|uniref:(Fe-S)-binding protein n=1 Tax=Desulfuribacillus alkaliarsenatis TaxID=766136 RepID=A0A1E5G2Y4_9FIRM|nr:4Fe-4S dicluster domain-containing protein [Desulfuribacillus alkaliarsenatis]OEF97445.1 (Fe-S)-binding protein [Desulfuribacillus alkaliarsenatis]